MLEWIWAGFFLATGVGAIARSTYVEYIENQADDVVGRILMIVMGVCGILLSALIPSDVCVIPLLRWFSRVLPEPESGIHSVTAGVMTGAVVLAYVIAVAAVTTRAIRRCAGPKNPVVASGPTWRQLSKKSNQ